MKLSTAKIEILKEAEAAGANGLMWLPDKHGWFTPEGKRLRSPSVFSLGSTSWLEIRRVGEQQFPKDYSIHHFTATITENARKFLAKA